MRNDYSPVPVLGRLHIQVRLLGLLAFAILLPWQPAAGLWVAALVVLGLLVAGGRDSLAILASLRRIRWLLLSLAVLYLGFTPGEPLFPALGDGSPTWLGIGMLVERASVLILMLVVALLVLRASGKVELAAGMQQLLAPLCRFGLVPERLPQRFGLLFHEIDAIEVQVRETRGESLPFLQRAARLWLSLEHMPITGDERVEDDQLLVLPRVPAWQWSIPLIITVGGIAGLATGA